MSTIYSAGQYDDAFTPKRLGNWESTAKKSYPFRKTPKLHIPKIIVDSRGHLLPWVPRGDRTSSWGLLNFHLRNKNNKTTNMVFMSAGSGKQTTTTSGDDEGSGHQSGSLSVQKRLKKLPKYAPRRMENLPPPDLLLEYLQHLSLPVVWIIGPSTRNTFQKRKQFSKQLAASLEFGYVNLDEKIQEWKERQQICTCGSSTNSVTSSPTSVPPLSPPHGPLHSLAQTSIAPSKLPTNVPPFISPNIPSPPLEASGAGDASQYILKILESQRIIFDTAVPIERNKILELYKFAMAECLPCAGFIFDSVPFDLLEGLQFEKVFYPAALAIYFTEGVPQRKQKIKPKDRRVTANSTTSDVSTKKVLMSPLDYLERSRKHYENVHLKTKNHKRLGVFNLVEGEKICKQFGSKTIRIINAEDVESDTMQFLNELVRKNLGRYHEIIKGNAKLDFGMDCGGNQFIPCSYAPSSSAAVIQPPLPSSTCSSSFISEDEQLILLKKDGLVGELSNYRKTDTAAAKWEASTNMPPALVTAHQSETTLLTLPNIFSSASGSSTDVTSSVAMSPRCVPPLEEQVNVSEDAVELEDEKNFPKVRNAVVDVQQYENETFIANSSTQPGGPTTTFGNQQSDPDIRGGSGDYVDNSVNRKDALDSASKVPKGRKSAELWERIVKLESKVAELNTPEESLLLSQENQGKVLAVDETYFDLLPPPTAYAEYDSQENFEKEDEEKFTAAIRNAISSSCIVAAPTTFHHYHQQQHQNTLPQQYYQHHHGQSLIDYDYGASGDCGNGIMIPQQYNNYNNYPPCHHYHQEQNEKSIDKLPEIKQQRKQTTQDPFYDD